MKELKRDELKKIKGGIIAYQSGYNLVGSTCYVDYTYWQNGVPTTECHVVSLGVCCSSGGCYKQVNIP
jgi:hypothetical protein